MLLDIGSKKVKQVHLHCWNSEYLLTRYLLVLLVDITNILLKQQNLNQLLSIFREVSDPKHVNYGKYLSKKEIHSIIGAHPNATKEYVIYLLN